MRSCAVGSRGGAELGAVAELGGLQPKKRLLVMDAELCTAIEMQPYSCTATVCRIVVVGVAVVGARSVRQLFVSCTYETSQFGQPPGTGRIDVTRREPGFQNTTPATAFRQPFHVITSVKTKLVVVRAVRGV